MIFLSIILSYILVVFYYWKVINEKLDDKVPDKDKEILNQLEERLNNHTNNN